MTWLLRLCEFAIAVVNCDDDATVNLRKPARILAPRCDDALAWLHCAVAHSCDDAGNADASVQSSSCLAFGTHDSHSGVDAHLLDSCGDSRNVRDGQRWPQRIAAGALDVAYTRLACSK